jgi:hypothetical protein
VSFYCLGLNVMLCGPADATDSISAIRGVVDEWNGSHAQDAKLMLRVRHWETDAHSVMMAGRDGQAIINQQLVDEADIVIAVFHSRLGSPTPRAVAGSVEEIQKALDKGLRLSVFFSKGSPPGHTDPDQYIALQQFKRSLPGTVCIESLTILTI